MVVIWCVVVVGITLLWKHLRKTVTVNSSGVVGWNAKSVGIQRNYISAINGRFGTVDFPPKFTGCASLSCFKNCLPYCDIIPMEVIEMMRRCYVSTDLRTEWAGNWWISEQGRMLFLRNCIGEQLIKKELRRYYYSDICAFILKMFPALTGNAVWYVTDTQMKVETN